VGKSEKEVKPNVQLHISESVCSDSSHLPINQLGIPLLKICHWQENDNLILAHWPYFYI